MRSMILWIASAALSCSVPAVGATASLSGPDLDQREQVGIVNFPTSCTKSAQSSMEKGLALLHSFPYAEAEESFTGASRLDPGCALA